MKIYTSYYGNLKNIPKHIVPISISGKAPEQFRGLSYKKLAPKIGFFNEWKRNHNNEYYVKNYALQVLDTTTIYEVLSELESISDGHDIVLLCYETPEKFCHRHLVAAWLNAGLGDRFVTEYPSDNLYVIGGGSIEIEESQNKIIMEIMNNEQRSD